MAKILILRFFHSNRLTSDITFLVSFHVAVVQYSDKRNLKVNGMLRRTVQGYHGGEAKDQCREQQVTQFHHLEHITTNEC